jgi:mannose-6-phosphate isomerase-like protein (cupin superfamily)
MLERITHGQRIIALILRASFREQGIHFFTPDDFSQQLAYMNHPARKVIPPHVHNVVPREVLRTQEVLLIRSGRVRVDFYDDDRRYLESRELIAGDVILLAGGGHGFEMLEPTEMIEVKQGPYDKDLDKTRFEPAPPARIVVSGQGV